MSLGQNIRQKRKEMDMTQWQLADKIGVSESQISNIEVGKRSTSPEKLAKIADALHCNVADLYDLPEKEQIDDAWILFAKKMKNEGIDPEEAEKWIKYARKIIGKS